MKKWLLLIILLILTLLIGYRLSLPVYQEINNVKSDKNGYVKHYIVKDDIRYVTDYKERALETLKYPYGRKIGVTDGGLRVHKVSGQSPDNYLLVTGFMMVEAIYRNESVPFIELSNASVHEIELKQAKGSVKSTDQSIISEVISSLEDKSYSKVEGEITIQRLLLKSEEIEGMAYAVYVVIDEKQNVYFEEIAESGKIPAGPLFRSWALEN